MVRVHRAVAVCLVLGAGTWSGCGGARHAATPAPGPRSPVAAAPRGTVTGIASPCHPQLAGSAQLAGIGVLVTILGPHGTVVARQTVFGRHVYAVTLAPGRYQVVSAAVGTEPVTVTVTPHRRVWADLLSDCI